MPVGLSLSTRRRSSPRALGFGDGTAGQWAFGAQGAAFSLAVPRARQRRSRTTRHAGSAPTQEVKLDERGSEFWRKSQTSMSAIDCAEYALSTRRKRAFVCG